ncbi:unnamed protein product [Microthlaspi erraticum]|uniref:Uncharacterized protein n=1 Tax=Microthlaspi erraticum TaxID=1685480 RepID=A0A6D2IS16_9BRAS|nr:unnamed protein product [Microthlaspi erraticum]
MDLLYVIGSWSMDYAVPNSNLVANAIVVSVTRDHRYGSYVGNQGPGGSMNFLRWKQRNRTSKATSKFLGLRAAFVFSLFWLPLLFSPLLGTSWYQTSKLSLLI